MTVETSTCSFMLHDVLCHDPFTPFYTVLKHRTAYVCHRFSYRFPTCSLDTAMVGGEVRYTHGWNLLWLMLTDA
jgi:hypothetical protein